VNAIASIARRSFLTGPSTLTLLLLSVVSSPAQVSSTDSRCIVEVNKGLRKVAGTENKELGKCLRSFVKGTLPTPTVLDCAGVASNPKVQKAVQSATDKNASVCAGAPPSFGPPSLTDPPLQAVQATADMARDLFGADVDAALSTDLFASRC